MRVGLLACDVPAGAPADLVVLDAPADVDDYARVLYARLRDADQMGLGVVLARSADRRTASVLAVIDRLRRASVRNDTGTSSFGRRGADAAMTQEAWSWS